YAERIGGSLAQGAIGIVLSAVTVVATLVVIPVISAYIMLEGEALQRATLRIIPVRSRARMLAIGHDLDHVLGGFVRGQVLVGAVIGTAITVMLLITHVRYALLIGVAAGILNIIPYVGSIVAFVPSVSLAFFYDGWQHAVLVAALFVAIFQLDGHFITPKIVSGSVGLTPLMVIVAILIGAELMGIAGMFLAVPIAGILRVLVMHAFGIATTETPAAAAAERPRTTTKASA
ncbi:MAG: AI-2E family transporter, partial [Vulcanimicrobiaceae bacterium]